MSDPKPTKQKSRLGRMIVITGGAVGLMAAGAAGGIVVVQSGLFARAPAPAAIAAAPAPHESFYHAIDQGFTANLRDSSSFIQASIAVSGKTAAVADAVKANEPAMRSVILQLLADQDYATISTPVGRKALQSRMRAALDAELRAKVGIGGIDNVYFTAFVLQ